MSAITALTAQNTTGISGVMEVNPDFLKNQIDMVFTDIYPDAVKIGMVSNSNLIKIIAERLSFYKADNIVVDPVMVSTSGCDLLENEAVKTMKEYLFPLAILITPNIPEAEILSGLKIESEFDMEKAALLINEKYNCNVLLKGGHRINDANDVLCMNGKNKWIYGQRIDNDNTHGTGCTLSSAIASNLAKGFDLLTSVKRSKKYLSGALSSMLNLGKSSGPMNHAFNLTGEFLNDQS